MSISDALGGEIRLAATVEDYFTGLTIDTGRWVIGDANTWYSVPPAVANGLVELDGAYLRSQANMQPLQPRFFEARAQLRVNGANAGWPDLGFYRELPPLAYDTTYPADSALRVFVTRDTNTTFARGRDGDETQPLTDVEIAPFDLTQFHLFRIEWAAEESRFFVDDVLQATIPGQATLNTWAFLYHQTPTTYGVSPMRVDWARAGQYAPSGSYTSCVYDAGEIVTWSSASLLAAEMSSETVVMLTRSSLDGETWSAWEATATDSIPSPAGRFFQYRLQLSTGNPMLSPEVRAVEVVAVPPATPTPTATSTPTDTPEPTATATATATNTPEPTATATATPTDTPEPTATNTSQPTPTATTTATSTPEPTATATPTLTSTSEPTATATGTPTDTPEPTATNTSQPTPTATATATNTPEPTPTVTTTNTPEPTATSTTTPTNTPVPTPTATATATNTPAPTATPTPTQIPYYAETEWSQHGHDALRTSYQPLAIPTPWRWKWSWNGPTATGTVSAGKTGLPRNSQPVTGGGRVYVAAGSRGVFALDNANGSVLWNQATIGTIASTPAYHAPTASLFVVSTDGKLYKLNAATGAVTSLFATNQSSSLPLPPALHGNRLFFSMGQSVYALDTGDLHELWRYDAGSSVDTPPSYSPATDLVVAGSRDLYVHAIAGATGAQRWRVKPTSLNPGDPGYSAPNAEVSRGWPVIAEEHGLVMIKLRLNWQTLWTWSPWPGTNTQMRANLTAQPNQEALMVLRLQDGSKAFVANIGHGGYGDGNYMPMGFMPVVKRFDNGQEVAYVVMRGSPCLRLPCDGRGDARLGEMLLDDTTVAGYLAGYVRFMNNTYVPTDEQPYLTMAGNQLYAGHWEAGLAHTIVDRSPSRGTGSAPITTSNLPHIATSQDSDVCRTGFSTTHYCATGLRNTRDWPGGFYIYWRQGAVYDAYWSEYAQWVIGKDTLYFVSADGTIVALESSAGTTTTAAPAAATIQTIANDLSSSDFAVADSAPQLAGRELSQDDLPVISYLDAAAYAGQRVTVEGTLADVFNNGKAAYLGFKSPHRGVFVARIMAGEWANFPVAPERIYRAGQRVRVSGTVGWYQGDPVIYVTAPEQVEIVMP
ncbi:MAG: PQQ-binding-like beta-propeller repeat protein [Caldilinea sp.]|nr:PQQ-binding-like beta-propeller repeat protein [Caldilinea sp.]